MSEHIIGPKIYLTIFGVLLVLTFVTYQVAFLNLGRWNTMVAMAIAVSKALLVVLYFMHVRYSSRLTRIVVVSGLFWFGLQLVLTLSDYLTRSGLRYPLQGP